MNHHHSTTPYPIMNVDNQLADCFSSDEGCQILTNSLNDECKVLQEIRKILEKRITFDEQYAKNLQDLTVTANKISWPISTKTIAPIFGQIFTQWSQLATTIISNIELVRKTLLNDLLKELLEQKTDSKKYLDEEKRRYDSEYRKAQRDVADAEKRYIDEAKSYAAKSNELTKLQNNARKNDESRIKNLKDTVIEKRGNVYRAHNDYIYKIREYNFIDKENIQKLRKLLNYHEESQLFINKSWQKLLQLMTDFSSYKNDEKRSGTETLRQMISFLDLRHFNDEMFRSYSNIPKLTINPITFNELLLQVSGLVKLQLNQYIGDSSTRHELKQKIQTLTRSINEPIPKIVDFARDKQNSYDGRKDLFAQQQLVDCLKVRKRFEGQLRDELKSTLRDAGYRSDDESDDDLDENLTDQLEDQFYFHGVIPRHQAITKLVEKGDYLVRSNEQGKPVLSILWTDPYNSNRLKDGHFLIHKRNDMYAFQIDGVSKPSIPQLISFYKRQKLELRNDGTRLIRPITRPNYIINNDEIRIMDTIGKGHFGNVVRGEYRGQFVAIKILHESATAQSADSRKSFINEALLLQQYEHKNIVKFLGIAAMRDPLMIIMELIEQGSLSNFLQHNELRVSQLIQMCYDIAKGMKYLEQRYVIHRDLAARNCLVDRKNHVKVADFGLSRCLQTDEEYFCQAKEVPVRWWALEIFLNAPYTSKSDVWSYGVTIWEIFSKADMPYGNILLNHLVIDAVKRGERLTQPERCPPKMFAIMSLCWIDNPSDRPNFEKLVELIKKEKSLF